MAKPRLFTIGYEGADPDRFLAALQDAGVAVLADVRAVALSRKRGFSKSALRDALAQRDIGYDHFIRLGTPKEGRQAARAGDAATMQRIYCEEVLAAPDAQEAFEQLAELALNRPTCLLCFERDPAVCHRRILSDRLRKRGLEVVDLFAI
ncbi:DUF488 family protein [Microvirga thermotolerans]|uniref:DUF488 family protein n=1 Tax=Microvirga thermotolerans TaxID=2651334 RepID=A0A5P9JT41_9HYPH|nr:DUF488 domain-containing protein [Microvirga thermotolerans]QFU15583.1 DUF488 family protein [Microvirga thermotolerans]